MATYLRNLTLFDGLAVRRKAGVLVEGDRVVWSGAHARAPRSAREAEEIDVAGGTVTPGLFDCHVHLCMDGAPDFVGEAQIPEGYAAIKGAGNARRQLEAGVTTVRDLGGIGFVVPQVARAIDEGRIPGPRVIASGRALTITGGHGWNSFAQQCDGPDGVRLAVREQLRGGARSIKIVATGGVLTPGVSVDFTAFTPEEVAAAVDEAHKWNVPIAAHAIGRTGIDHCVRAGIDSIEHGAQISAETAREMTRKGTCFVPTISALQGIIGHPESVPAFAVAKGNQIVDMLHESFARAVKAGVRFACGTDAGTPYNPHGSAPRELVSMVEFGLPAIEAMKAATSTAAALCRVPDAGVLEAGRAADLVVWAGDPTEDIRAVLAPQRVMRAGAWMAGSEA